MLWGGAVSLWLWGDFFNLLGDQIETSFSAHILETVGRECWGGWLGVAARLSMRIVESDRVPEQRILSRRRLRRKQTSQVHLLLVRGNCDTISRMVSRKSKHRGRIRNGVSRTASASELPLLVAGWAVY